MDGAMEVTARSTGRGESPARVAGRGFGGQAAASRRDNGKFTVQHRHCLAARCGEGAQAFALGSAMPGTGGRRSTRSGTNGVTSARLSDVNMLMLLVTA